jgi:tartrate dehydrogenase/decarboxylase/D-malate dehydrogenase
MIMKNNRIAAIPGDGIANPVATFCSATMMLDHPGETAAAQCLIKAIEAVKHGGQMANP